jgi:hypoxanthine-guanine phosphoribosyltransferase
LADALLRSDKLLHDREQLDTVIADMGRAIDATLDGERAVFLTVMNGALIFAGQLALTIRTDLEFDYVHATRYRGATIRQRSALAARAASCRCRTAPCCWSTTFSTKATR